MPTYNLLSDFSSSLTNWNTQLNTDTGLVTLNIPAGTFTGAASTSSQLAYGGETVVIQGAGVASTFLEISGISGAGAMPPNGTDPSNRNPQPRIYSVQAGSNSVRLIDPRHYTKFIVGHWCIVSGCATQLTGYPPNWDFFEYKKILSAASTGVITLDGSLKYSYRSYWPDYPSFSQFDSDNGGAACCWPILNTANVSGGPITPRSDGVQIWAQDLTCRDCTIRGFGGGMASFFGGCRKVLFEDCNFPGYSPTPGGSSSWIARNCTISGMDVEIDKLIEYLEFDSCVWSGGFGMSAQSSSTHYMYIHDCTIDADLAGTTGDTVIENTTITDNLQIGTSFYGNCRSVTLDTVTAGDLEGTMESPASSLSDSAQSPTISSGVITMTRSVFESAISQQSVARIVPGSGHVLRGTSERRIYGCKIADFRVFSSSGGNIEIRTNITDATAFNDAQLVGFVRHPCMDINVTNSGGCGRMRVLSRYPANVPMYSYYHSGTWDGVGLEATGKADQSPLFGRIRSITVNVTKVYSGALGALKAGLFGAFGTNILKADMTYQASYTPKIDLLTLGTRIITPAGVTGTAGTDSGLTLDADATWMSRPFGTDFSPTALVGSTTTDISGESSSVYPTLTIEVILDQELSGATTIGNTGYLDGLGPASASLSMGGAG